MIYNKAYVLLPATLSLYALLTCCQNIKPNIPNQIPPIISTPIVSEKCDIIIYGTNEDNLTQPIIMEGYFTKGSTKKKKIKVEGQFDIHPVSVSCDCKLISLTGHDPKIDKTYTYFYDVQTQEVVNITEEKTVDFSSPHFSPVSTHLSYLLNSKLHITDYLTFTNENITNPPNIRFKSQMWSTQGKYIYLEDSNTSIWRYYTKDKKFHMLWEAPEKFSLSRMITLSEEKEDVFHFISDHESDYIQIYRFSDSSTTLLTHSNYDNYLFRIPLKTDTLYYKSNEDGVFFLKEYYSGKVKNSFPQTDGEVIRYFPNNKVDIYFYADHKHPLSLYVRKNNQFENVIEGLNDTMPDPNILFNKYGMINLIYFPTGTPKGWILWLHGGPNAQVLRSYELHFSYFLKSGWGVIALNFPGSSGIGNRYEMEDKDKEDLIQISLSVIREDLIQIRNKYPTIDKVAVIGVSYGSILSRLYSKKYGDDVTHLVDFAGLGDFAGKEGIPILYVYGKDDFALSKSRRKMISKSVKAGNGRVFEVESEGHAIMRLDNRQAVLQEIMNFLSGDK